MSTTHTKYKTIFDWLFYGRFNESSCELKMIR